MPNEKRERPKPNTVELVRSTYCPTKAEIDQEFEVDLPEDDDPNYVDATMDQLAEAILQPVNPRWINQPRNRRK